jgi:hypothetical protein
LGEGVFTVSDIRAYVRPGQDKRKSFEFHLFDQANENQGLAAMPLQ